MAIPVHIPKLGMTMSEAQLTGWKFREGDWVEKGRPVLAIETEKITFEISATGSGYLHIIAKTGKALVGAVVGFLAASEEELRIVQRDHPATESGTDHGKRKKIDTDQGSKGISPPLSQEEKFIPSSPAARRLAKELNIDLTSVSGTGPDGRITETDVKKYHEQGKNRLAAPAGNGDKRREAFVESVKSIPLRGMRKAIADNMRASLHTTAQLTTFTEVDVTEMVKFREVVRQEFKNDPYGAKASYNDIIIMAVSRALKRFPILNSTLAADEIIIHKDVNIGIAVALAEGLIVPVLKNADSKSLLQIARESRELADKARKNTLGVDEVTGGTFTITNISMFEVDGATPILRPPESGILGVGRVREKPAIYEGKTSPRSMMYLCLTFDHQVVDGAPAAEFLQTTARFLHEPYLIML